MDNVREFNKDDWLGFQDAAKWPNGDEPIIAHGKTAMMLIDKNSGLAMVENDQQSEEDGGWILEVEFPTQLLARIFLEGFPNDFDAAFLKKVGFVGWLASVLSK